MMEFADAILQSAGKFVAMEVIAHLVFVSVKRKNRLRLRRQIQIKM
jgi:hypothetical protein